MIVAVFERLELSEKPHHHRKSKEEEGEQVGERLSAGKTICAETEKIFKNRWKNKNDRDEEEKLTGHTENKVFNRSAQRLEHIT